jgi:hypothetical protein
MTGKKIRAQQILTAARHEAHAAGPGTRTKSPLRFHLYF